MSTQIQGTIAGAMEALKFELEPSESFGGPARYKVTDKVIEYVQSIEGRFLVVDSDGEITVE